MPRAFTIALLAAFLAALMLAPAALATGDLTLGTGGTPAAGKVVSTGGGPLAFSIPAGCAGLNAYVEVASDVQYDADGTLYGPLTVERFGVTDSGNGLYQGTASGDWLQTPGTYYWQLDGLGACDAAGADFWVGPVTSIVVKSATTAPPPTDVPEDATLFTLDQARAAVPLAIKAARRRIPRKLTRACTRAGSGDVNTITCRSTWNDKVAYQYTGTFTMLLDDTGDIVTRFDGRRATLKCLKQRRRIGTKKCYKVQHFDATL
jgi:hypothetical protein